MSAFAVLADLRSFAGTVLLAIGALLPIVDPLGGAPIYLAMTAGLTPAERSRMAKAVAVNSFLLLIAATLIGACIGVQICWNGLHALLVSAFPHAAS